jgi:hypothetical protein
MNRLNYFNPYQSKESHHEDQLTRAYLVLLKHSSHAFFTFIEYVRSKHITKSDEDPISIINFLENGWEIETQRGNPQINTNFLLSILISDSHLIGNQEKIQPSDRNARYDGIITFGNNLTMVIENKPRSGNVWFGQLSPSRQNLSDETNVYSNSSVLEWKEIIKQLNQLLSIQSISGNEKLMIEDFFGFVDENFPYLNPYDSFHQCKGNSELLNRRIMNLLKSIVLDESTIKYHRNWGYYIQTPYSQIKEIGLILKKDEKKWWIELALIFGSTQSQAISFYKSNPNLEQLDKNRWKIKPDFHVSFRSSNLVWFSSDDSDIYLKFWKANIDKIFQQKKENVSNYLNFLIVENVIKMTRDVEEELTEKFYNSAMPTLNICPGYGLIYSIESSEAEEKDKKGELYSYIANRINEGLAIVGLNGEDLLK